MSGTLEFQVTKKLFDGVYELFSGFFELGALVFCFSLIFWVSGLFLGLAVCSVRCIHLSLPWMAEIGRRLLRRAQSSVRASGRASLGVLLTTRPAQVFVAGACCYVLLCAVGMNWCLDRIRVYLRDCLVLRMCSVCIPMVSVLRGLRFTTGVTVCPPF